jgi:hypothetical protein
MKMIKFVIFCILLVSTICGGLKKTKTPAGWGAQAAGDSSKSDEERCYKYSYIDSQGNVHSQNTVPTGGISHFQVIPSSDKISETRCCKNEPDGEGSECRYACDCSGTLKCTSKKCAA